ncbi:hypothetical protein GHT06_008365 [Daphnia sinensis]|uniref:Uncharacterized protein n=1 Tax=Daphnia sinensis TaxID=1820382 RepID=A0AAD5L3L4_9CRUS|nr:hypothetical protein GHT06_008365 [Daphnia sinensis]
MLTAYSGTEHDIAYTTTGGECIKYNPPGLLFYSGGSRMANEVAQQSETLKKRET